MKAIVKVLLAQRLNNKLIMSIKGTSNNEKAVGLRIEQSTAFTILSTRFQYRVLSQKIIKTIMI